MNFSENRFSVVMFILIAASAIGGCDSSNLNDNSNQTGSQFDNTLAAPDSVSATADLSGNTTQLFVNWRDESTAENQFEVQTSVDGTHFTSTFFPGSTGDTGLGITKNFQYSASPLWNTTLYVRVRAAQMSGNAVVAAGVFSDTVTVQTCNAGFNKVNGVCTAINNSGSGNTPPPPTCSNGLALNHNNQCVCLGRFNGTQGAYMQLNADLSCTLVNGSFNQTCSCSQSGNSITMSCSGMSIAGTAASDCSSVNFGGMNFPR